MNPGSCRDRRVPSFQNEIDPEIRPMSQDSLSLGFEHQLNRDSVFTLHYIHNELRDTIEDIGFLNAEGDEGYLIGNPGRGSTSVQFPTGATPPVLEDGEPLLKEILRLKIDGYRYGRS